MDGYPTWMVYNGKYGKCHENAMKIRMMTGGYAHDYGNLQISRYPSFIFLGSKVYVMFTSEFQARLKYVDFNASATVPYFSWVALHAAYTEKRFEGLKMHPHLQRFP